MKTKSIAVILALVDVSFLGEYPSNPSSINQRTEK